MSVEEWRDAGTLFFRAWTETMLRFIYLFFISFKLHEYSAALEDVRGGFVSRRACKYLHLLAVVVTGLWGIL